MNSLDDPHLSQIRIVQAKLFAVLDAKPVYTLHALKMNGTAAIELHSIIERRAIDTADSSTTRKEALDQLQRKGILDKEDRETYEELRNLRSSLVHSNFKKLADILEAEGIQFQEASLYAIREEMRGADVLVKRLIIGTLRLLTKLHFEDLGVEESPRS